MRDFKKKLLFFLLLLLVLAGASFLCSPAYIKLSERAAGRNKCVAGVMSEPPDSLDVLIIGDSLSSYNISPMEMWKKQGISSYVLGQSGQTAAETYYLFKQALKTQSPKVLVLETNLFFRYEDIFSETENSLAETMYYHFPALRFHDIWKSYAGMNKPSKYKYYKGFEIHNKVNPYAADDYMKRTDESRKIYDLVRHYLDKIVKECEEQQIQLLLVSAPSPLNYNYKKHNAIQEFADTYQVPYLDFNLKESGLTIDWATDTMDNGDHLNYQGAVKLSDCLADYLKEQYGLSDHRGEAAYEAWNKELEQYLADVGAEKMEKL